MSMLPLQFQESFTYGNLKLFEDIIGNNGMSGIKRANYTGHLEQLLKENLSVIYIRIEFGHLCVIPAHEVVSRLHSILFYIKRTGVDVQKEMDVVDRIYRVLDKALFEEDHDIVDGLREKIQKIVSESESPYIPKDIKVKLYNMDTDFLDEEMVLDMVNRYVYLNMLNRDNLLQVCKEMSNKTKNSLSYSERLNLQHVLRDKYVEAFKTPVKPTAYESNRAEAAIDIMDQFYRLYLDLKEKFMTRTLGTIQINMNITRTVLTYKQSDQLNFITFGDEKKVYDSIDALVDDVKREYEESTNRSVVYIEVLNPTNNFDDYFIEWVEKHHSVYKEIITRLRKECVIVVPRKLIQARSLFDKYPDQYRHLNLLIDSIEVAALEAGVFHYKAASELYDYIKEFKEKEELEGADHFFWFLLFKYIHMLFEDEDINMRKLLELSTAFYSKHKI